MAIPERPSAASRPTYTDRLNVSDVRNLVKHSLQNQYGHQMSSTQLKEFMKQHPDLNTASMKKVVSGITSARKGTVEAFRVKKFLEVLGKTVRGAQNPAGEQPARMSVQGRRALHAPKATMKHLRDMRLESLGPAGPTKAELEQQEKIALQRKNMQRFERNKEMREEMNVRIFGKSQARSSVMEDTPVTDFHKGAQTSATDYHSIPTSVSDVAAGQHEPMASASDRNKAAKVVNLQQRATSPDDADSGEENIDDDLPLAA